VFEVKTKKKKRVGKQATKTHIQNWKCRGQYATNRIGVFFLKIGIDERNVLGINNLMQRGDNFRYIEIKKKRVATVYPSMFPTDLN
jgi:hypothetical protein